MSNLQSEPLQLSSNDVGLFPPRSLNLPLPVHLLQTVATGLIAPEQSGFSTALHQRQDAQNENHPQPLLPPPPEEKPLVSLSLRPRTNYDDVMKRLLSKEGSSKTRFQNIENENATLRKRLDLLERASKENKSKSKDLEPMSKDLAIPPPLSSRVLSHYNQAKGFTMSKVNQAKGFFQRNPVLVRVLITVLLVAIAGPVVLPLLGV